MLGVRQGCPLSPILFTLTTQPLMELLKFKLATGELKGLKLKDQELDQESLCHKISVDDIGLFLKATEAEFRCAWETVQQYENISGALLNVQKSKLNDSYFSKWV